MVPSKESAPAAPTDSVVFIVDDDSAFIAACSLRLHQRPGCSVRGFKDPRKALSAALGSPPDVVVIKRSMDGVELATSIREQLRSRAPRLVLVSADVVRRVDLTHFDAHFRKPLRVSDLARRVGALLDAGGGLRRKSSHTRLARHRGERKDEK